jgi:hypothetical protein
MGPCGRLTSAALAVARPNHAERRPLQATDRWLLWNDWPERKVSKRTTLEITAHLAQRPL